MSLLAIRTESVKPIVWITGALIVVYLSLLIALWDRFEIGLHTFARIPLAITATVITWAGIIEWWWKRWPFNRVLKVPDLEGTWTGHLESNWVRGKTDPRRQIEIAFVIHQTLVALTVLSYTADRRGCSRVAEFLRNEAAHTLDLAYIYSLRDEFRAGDGVQQGAAEVSVVGRQLRGEYWTNTNTRGRLILSIRGKAKVASFQEAKQKWGNVWQGFS